MNIQIFKKNTKSTYLFSRRLGTQIRKSLAKYNVYDCRVEIFFEEIKSTKSLTVNMYSKEGKKPEKIHVSSDNFWTCVTEVNKKLDKILSLKQDRMMRGRRNPLHKQQKADFAKVANQLSEISMKRQNPIFVDIENEMIDADDILKYEEAKKNIRKIAS